MRFGPFDIAYPQLTEQMEALKFDPTMDHVTTTKRVFDFHKDDPAYPEPHWSLLESYKVTEIELEGFPAPELPMPGPRGQKYVRKEASEEASGSANDAAGGSATAGAVVPKRFGLRFDPPTLVMEYEEAQELKHLVIPVELRKESSVNDVANDIFATYASHINVKTVKKNQLIRLIAMLKTKL